MLISLHEKTTLGWKPVKTLPHDSKEWDEFDRDWIETLFNMGSVDLRIGNLMYTVESKSIAG